MNSPVPSFKQNLDRFLFATEIPYGLALTRILLPLVVLQGVLARWRWCEELFSTNGVTVSLLENYHTYNYLQPLPPFWCACLYSMFIVFLITASIGWYTRFSLWAVFALHAYFACNDVATSMTKFTVISLHAFMILALSECGRVWSVDSLLAGLRDPNRAPLSERPEWALAPVWPARILNLMIGVTYLGAAITKLHMPEFITGEAISYWIMSNPNFRHQIGEVMTQYPGMLIVSGHFTVLWEVLFIFLVWIRGTPRTIMLMLGLFFHGMAALTLGEVIFLMVMSSCYLGCLSEQEIRSLGRLIWYFVPAKQMWTGAARPLFPATFRGFSAPGQLVTLCSLLAVVGLGGAWANHRLDLYGVRRPEGPWELREISQEEAARLFTRNVPIRESDKFLGVKVGSIVVSGRLANNCEKFQHGQEVFCEASLNPPHEDMWIECHLYGADHKILEREGLVVAREARFARFGFMMTPVLEPGEYTFVIRSRGQEICRRSFTLDGGAQAPVESVAEVEKVRLDAPVAN